MIIMWPLVVSKTVNPNILPGVCKALEKYVYMYELDAVIETANKNIRDNKKKNSRYNTLKKIGDALFLESSEVDPLSFIEEASGPKPAGRTQVSRDLPKKTQVSRDLPKQTQTSRDPYRDAYAAAKAKDDYTKKNPSEKEKERDQYADAYAQAKAKDEYQLSKGGETPNIGRIDQTAMSAEPTWNVVTDQEGRTTAIGVKVVPFIINNEESLIKLMTLDRYRDSLSKSLHINARKILKFMHNLANKTWKATIGGLLSWTGFVDDDLVAGTITQNWKNDIILQNTAFGDKMFILISKMDIDDDFTTSAGGVKGLFSLGWASFIIADDMNKVANFCMKSYKGMCSMVNYGYLYADARSQNQVYQDIAKMGSAGGPMFRLKNNRKSVMTDSLAHYKLDQYSSITETYLSESVFNDMVNLVKNSPSKITSNLKSMSSAIKRNDMRTIQTIVKKFIPGDKHVDLGIVIEKMNNNNPDFRKNYDLAHLIFKNALPKVSDNVIKSGASLLSCLSIVLKDTDFDIKTSLKKIIDETRIRSKTQKEDDDNFSKDLTFAFSFALIAFIFGTSIIVFLIHTITTLLPVAAVVLSQIAYIALIILVLSFLASIVATKEDRDNASSKSDNYSISSSGESI